MQQTPPPDARTRVLDAAERLVRGHGVSGLTIEAVAREAGVSKGGLLYHFASKEALLAALLARLAGMIAATFAAAVAAQPAGPARAARAVLDFALSIPQRDADDHLDRAAAVLLAAHHHDPALLAPVRAVMAEISARMQADGTPPGVAAAVLAVKDGLMLARIFGLYALDSEARAALHATMARALAL